MAIYIVTIPTQCYRCGDTIEPGQQAQRESVDSPSVHYPHSCIWQGWLSLEERQLRRQKFEAITAAFEATQQR